MTGYNSRDKKVNSILLWLAMFAFLFGTLAGCSVVPTVAPTTTHFFLLDAVDIVERADKEDDGYSVGIHPVVLPSYLNRPQLVSRIALNELYLSENNRWGEPLKENISRVLFENIKAILENSKVERLPKQGKQPAYAIQVYIDRFERFPDQRIYLDAYWKIGGGDRGELMRSASLISDPVDVAGESATVKSMSELLKQLSIEISASIK
ncbi:MAG: membrane integrity-associated transporter subunit PqiC [Gammaproteobacteria bacterium]|uniref:Membrane integrity-associated transporter subunit PqiC n=1 Tax=Candidatus Thiopontia autotrophica TaxID=2841688 RepID=A0A8J6TXB3_9GAMM|nr:membrane integrity-associated transporter subunit PqiC [Candidatus Thiopontia autotrophica]MBL6969032.1 membrane integrity-associated transporter subunit PqiC [Gammaproteobacteria bacterium]